MFNFLDKTPEWLQPFQKKLGRWNDANPHLLWNGIKSMTYSFTVTMVISRGDYVKSLKSAGVAAHAEAISTIFKGIGERWGFSETTQNVGSKTLSFYWSYYVFRGSVDHNLSQIATIFSSLLALALNAPGLNIIGMTQR